MRVVVAPARIPLSLGLLSAAAPPSSKRHGAAGRAGMPMSGPGGGRMTAIRTLTSLALALAALTPLQAAVPPDRIHYQGVLRDAAGAPSTGSFDMVFRLFDSDVGGNEVILDRHLLVDGTQVVVTTGQFSVEIGSGETLDGSGPGLYETLAETSRDHGDLWLEIQIDAETLAPRLHLASAGYALNARTLAGREAGEFIDTSEEAQTKAGQLNLLGAPLGEYQPALTAVGFIGANISSILGPSVYLGNVDEGVSASGAGAGGGFYSYGGAGVKAYGTVQGGHFEDLDNPSWVDLAQGDIGVSAQGQNVGGSFQTPGNVSWTVLSYYLYGMAAGGSASPAGDPSSPSGGHFSIRDASGSSFLASAELAHAYKNPSGIVYSFGGWFDNVVSGSNCTIAGQNEGIDCFGGGRIRDLSYDTEASLAINEIGISAYGRVMGGEFRDTDSSGSVRVGYETYKIQGPGSVAFVQNHPTDKDKVIVYNSPEGDEVATYTRGSGRLAAGEARIPLGETFAWVTNPDLGLTAHVTPRDEAVPLAVVSVTTKELVVRGPADGPQDLAFDYLVYGLRIGFEETSIVQEKREESYIPSMADHRKRYEDHPELRRFNALERVKATRQRMGFETAPSLSTATALRNAIHEFDPKVDVVAPIRDPEQSRPRPGRAADGAAGSDPGVPGHLADASPSRWMPTPRTGDAGSASPAFGIVASTQGQDESGSSDRTPGDGVAPVETLRVSEPVRAGDLLAVDPTQPDRVRRAEGIGDTGFIGVAQADSNDGEVELATARVLRVQADAGYGAIALGNPLTTSPTPGAAMRALDPAPGSTFGKALDPLDSGIAEIRVLWMPR